jgi:outer membrane protein assembly factor BamB
MKRLSLSLAGIFLGLVASVNPVYCQGRGGSDWSTIGSDAQRTSSVRADPKISLATMQKPGFQFLWKSKPGSDALSAPSLMDRYIGYRGFRSYAFVGGAGNNIYVFDSDLARVEWKKHFPVTAAAATAACPAGMTASVARLVSAALPGANQGRGGGGGRGGPAKSGVGAPGEGAVTLSAIAPQPVFPVQPRGPGAAAPRPGRMPSFLSAVSSDGAFHNMYISNGEEPEAPIKFLPANAHATGLIVVDNVAYAVTSGNCGGAADAVWALDIATKTVTSWKGSVIGTAFGPDGTVYASTLAGDVAALEAKTLAKKSAFAAGQALASAPVVFEDKGKLMVAVAAKDGSLHVLDAATLSKVASSAPGTAGTLATYSLATWKDAAGARWILSGATAWKLNGTTLESGWTAPAAPASVAVVNGVVFTAARNTVSALDAATGKQLWTSGNAITSPISSLGGLAAGGSSVYLGTQDGTLYAFGFQIEH